MFEMSEVSHRNDSKQRAGAAWADVTPSRPVFLFGYPKVPRTSSGTNDPLLATALYLDDGSQRCLFVSVDVIWLSKRQVAKARKRINERVGVPEQNILIAASHTHSGPTTVAILSNEPDPVVPPPDPSIVAAILDGIVTAAVNAVQDAEEAEIGFYDAPIAGIGGNRHYPQGLSAHALPTMVVRAAATEELIALQYVYNVHPTVLHEDSTLFSGDFPGIARSILQARMQCDIPLPILHHLGAAGNQSPRHAVSANTLAEAERLGGLVADALEHAVQDAEFEGKWRIDVRHRTVELSLRQLPGVDAANRSLSAAQEALVKLIENHGDRADVRTAECNLFGAEELLTLAEAATTDKLKSVAQECLPAEIQVVRIGPRCFVAWPGEVFIEFSLELQRRYPDAVLITLANGELQGYLVTAEAVAKSWYESGNAIFASPDSANQMLEASYELLASEYRPSSSSTAHFTSLK